MSTLTMFAVCLTALLLLAGTAYTFFEFYRADRGLEAAELKRRHKKVRG